MTAPFDLGKRIVGAAGNMTDKTLSGVRDIVSASINWTGDQLGGLSKAPLITETEMSEKLRRSMRTVSKTSAKTSQALGKAKDSTQDAFRVAMESLNISDRAVRRALLENVIVSSVVGESFFGVVKTSDIQPSFRLDGRDVSPVEMTKAFQNSGLKHMTVCVPGLCNDETLWSSFGKPQPFTEQLKGKGSFPVCLRFNPGTHISENGRILLNLMNDLAAQPGVADLPFDVVSFSQGCLVTRSALYLAKFEESPFVKRIRRAVFISSPDGGSYIEKAGFWLGLGLEKLPLPILKWIGMVGNERSHAIKDLSHGIIRQEDWANSDQLGRYNGELYFGELDDIDAVQIYSLISSSLGPWSSLLGDGIVEESSLKLLSNRVYRKKSNPNKRVFCIPGKSHFQILHSPELWEILRDTLR